MSFAADAFRASQEALSEVYGESVGVMPMAGGDFSAGPDPERDVILFRAALITQVEAVAFKGQQTGSGSEFQGSSRVQTDDPQLWIDGPTVASLAWTPKRGDIVVALDRPGEPEFTFVSALKGDHGDLLCILSRSKRKFAP